MDSTFTPRKEFLRDQVRTKNDFCLLALAGTSFIRLYSFPPPLVAALRKAFDARGIVTAFREDVALNFVEFNLDGKPWANAKSVHTEKLLMDIITLIYSHGFSFLSNIDYGRENDDKLVMVFSSPAPSTIGLGSGSTQAGSPFGSPNLANGSGSTVSDTSSTGKRVPFALSFPSKDILRVVNPPLHLTPAILQGVRGSWPRGIVSEKKIGESTYEFKLKGYRWFQEDTFATDSLRHILSLLSALDQQAFCLLTSMSITGRSRIKDLWIFTGPAPTDGSDVVFPDSPAASILTGDIKRTGGPGSIEPPRYTQLGQGGSGHRKMASSPSPMSPGSMQMPLPVPSGHSRAATSPNSAPNSPVFPVPNFHPSPLGHGSPPVHPSQQYMASHPAPPQHPTAAAQRSPSLLRKAAPRAQVPVSVAAETGHDGTRMYRTALPSVISNDADNMTGVGAKRDPTVFYSSSSPGKPVANVAGSKPSRSPSPIYPVEHSQRGYPTDSEYESSHNALGYAAAAVGGTVAVHSAGKDSSYESAIHDDSSSVQYPPARPEEYPAPAPRPVHSRSTTPPLLGPGAFRNSDFSSRSSNVTDSCEVPISWTGLQTGTTANKDTVYEDLVQGRSPSSLGAAPPSAFKSTSENVPSIASDNRSSMPMIPGGWAPTPIDEKPELTAMDEHTSYIPQSKTTEPTENPNTARVVELTHPGGSARKSEAAFVGIMSTPQEAAPPLPQAFTKDEKDEGREAEAVSTNPVVVDATNPASLVTPTADGAQSPGGWVLVSVEGKIPEDAATQSARESGVEQKPTLGNLNPTQGLDSPEPLALGTPSTPTNTQPPLPSEILAPHASMSGAAKTIVILDAVETKNKANGGDPKNSSRIKRFFSKSKRNGKGTGASDSGSADESGSLTKSMRSNRSPRK